MKKYSLNVLMVVFAILLLFAAHFRWIDSYIQIVVMTIGINIMMSVITSYSIHYTKLYDEELYGAKPDDVGALTYDAFQLLFTAIEDAQSLDKADVRDAIAGIDLFEGVTGVMSFDEQGDPVKCAVIIEIKDGAFTYYDSACPAGFPPEDM